MTRRKSLCQRYQRGDSCHHNGLRLSRYYAAAPVQDLPSELSRDDHIVKHGYAVGFDEWFFFHAMAPAVAFGRAARTSPDSRGHGVFAAAQEIMFCDVHATDEIVLLVQYTDEGEVDRHD
uniref:hypothetical protein n=1 Tax=Amycolatopsis sp. CA-096443 TaxID=3239919 RepID=UPI003F496F7F